MPAGQMRLLVLLSIYPALSTCPGLTKVSINLETIRVSSVKVSESILIHWYCYYADVRAFSFL